MKIIKFNKTRFLKDLDFISRNRKSNFSNKANKGWPNPTLAQFSRFIADTGLELASAGC